MPIRELPKFKAVPDRMLEIPQPAIGGLNLKDLEFEQENNQSPYLLNVMYRNGAFGKRYGQEVYSTFSDVIYSTVYYDGFIFVHSGTNIYRQSGQGSPSTVMSGLPETRGIFIIFAQKLYYLISSGFYEYDGSQFGLIDSYIPDFIINAKPDGSSGGDVIDDLNILGTQFSIIYNGTADATEYMVGTYDDQNIIDWTVRPTIYLDDVETNDFTVDSTNKKITFTTAPGEGNLNVKMVFTMKADTFQDERSQILNCKFYDTFGGANNSRLFVAGGGNSKYFWSQAYDISYFPENNFATLGNTEDDITGFGRQYNVLIVFKPREVYSIYSYTETSTTTVIEENIGLESFRSQLVNARIGCDAPYSIQLINNLLTWYNSNEGVCTLVSTNIQDERNVRVISRNIEHTNNFSVKGILDYDEDPTNIQSADYNNRYFLVFPNSGFCFMWDYEISPFKYSTTGSETDPRNLSWFLFDHFYAKQFLKVEKQLLYVCGYNGVKSFSVHQYVTNGNFVSTDNWTTAGSATLSVSNNTAYVTVQNAGDGIIQRVGYIDSYIYENYIFKAPVGVRINNTRYGTGDYERIFFGVQVKGNGIITFALSDDLESPVTIEIQNVMMIESPSGTEDDYSQIEHFFSDKDYLGDGTIQLTLGADFSKALVKLNAEFSDLDFNNDGNKDAIHSYYMTPFFQFGAVEMLKNVKNVYVQCRGDTNTKIDLYYMTDDSSQPEQEPEPINVAGSRTLWESFSWAEFHWFMNIWGNTFRRKCNIKKIQMASMYFENNELNNDMSITHIGLQYQLVKYIR